MNGMGQPGTERSLNGILEVERYSNGILEVKRYSNSSLNGIFERDKQDNRCQKNPGHEPLPKKSRS